MEYRETESLWHKRTAIPKRQALKKDIRTDTVVIGGGMTGLLCAYELNKRGIETVVLEAARVGGGQSGNSTAKLTLLHGLKYVYLQKLFGVDGARQYAAINAKAIEEYECLTQEEKIDCCLERVPSYLYSQNRENRLREEFDVLRHAGVQACMTTETELAFPVTGAICVDGQAQFDPMRLLAALSEKVTVYEHSRVLSVQGTEVRTGFGTVKAKRVVFACHFPFVNMPGYYFARMHQSRSYVLALAGAPVLHGVYASVDKGGCAFRSAGDILLLSGAGHRTGKNREGGRYDYLSVCASEWYPEVQEIARWSAEDCMPIDTLPYIGQYATARPEWYVATGFGKWGMSMAMVAALLLADQITGRKNEAAGLFSPNRFKLAATDDLLNEGTTAVVGIARRFLVPPKIGASELPPGYGGVVEYDGHKVGAFRDEQGKLYTVETKCPHLGCELTWNPDERSWDCPCHGSRFSYTGKLLDGPAQTELSSSHQKSDTF